MYFLVGPPRDHSLPNGNQARRQCFRWQDKASIEVFSVVRRAVNLVQERDVSV